MLQSMDAIVSTSPNYAYTSLIIKKYVDSLKLKIIPLGILEEKLNIYRYNTEIFYNKRPNLKNKRYILFLGVLRYYKGLHTLIQSAKYINCIIVIAGMGPEFNTLLNQVNKLNVKNIIFTGEVDEIEKNILLKNCYALILPSHLRSEAYGMVLIEASMNSKPMVTCEIDTGTSYVNINNVTGIVVEPENPNQLTNAINHLLKNEKESFNLGKNARKRYEKFFSGTALGESYRNLYNDMIIKGK